MAISVLTPSREDLQKWGTLAYVNAKERERILGLPCGETHRALESLSREIETAKRKGKI